MTDASNTFRAVAVDRLPPITHRRERLVGPDVVRAVALIGVVVMNYHGYLNGANAAAGSDASFGARLFDPWNGVLATRFAATFMLVAGVGVTLLTERSRSSSDREAIRDDRWRLVRRGLLLYAVGFVLDWVWPGTILFFYGAAFVVAAFLFTLRTRWLVAVGATAAVAGAVLNAWVVDRTVDGARPGWLVSPDTLGTESPRGLMLDTWVNGTHPLLPWLAFLCAGMVLGRHLSTLGSRALGHSDGERPRVSLALIGGVGAAVTALTYAANHLLSSGRAGDEVWIAVWSTRPFDRGLLYTLGTLGSSLAAYALISWAAERWRDTEVVGVLRSAGEMTLTLYMGHVIVFLVLVDELEAIGSGLGTALVFATLYWLVALAAAAWWRRYVGIGPAERLYRRLGG